MLATPTPQNTKTPVHMLIFKAKAALIYALPYNICIRLVENNVIIIDMEKLIANRPFKSCKHNL